MKIGIIPVNVGYTSAEQLVAVAQAAEAAAYTAQPNSSGPRRPYRSLIGP